MRHFIKCVSFILKTYCEHVLVQQRIKMCSTASVVWLLHEYDQIIAQDRKQIVDNMQKRLTTIQMTLMNEQ